MSQGCFKKQSKKQFPVQLLFRFRGSSELRVGSIFGTILGSLHGWPELGPTSRFPTKQETQNRPGGTQFWFQKWNHFKNKIGFFSKHKRTHLRKTGTDFAVFSHTAGHQQVCIASFLNRSACKLHKLISLLCKTCF